MARLNFSHSGIVAANGDGSKSAEDQTDRRECLVSIYSQAADRIKPSVVAPNAQRGDGGGEAAREMASC
jgi:hypothetical protein